MAGQHIEREARHTLTGLTTAQRDEIILSLHRRKWTQRQIAKHLNITQPAVKYAIDRLVSKQRSRSTYKVCDGCGGNFAQEKINRDGFCPPCAV